MKHHVLTVGDKTYKFRVRAREHAELDMLFKGYGGFIDAISEGGAIKRPLDTLVKLLPVASKPFADENGSITDDDVMNMYDQLVEEDWSMEQFVKLIVGIGEASGFFPKEAAEEMDAEMEKQKAKARGNKGA